MLPFADLSVSVAQWRLSSYQLAACGPVFPRDRLPAGHSIVTGQAVRKSRNGRERMKTLWSRVPPALQLLQVFRTATGRQMRRSPDGGIIVKSAVAVFG